MATKPFTKPEKMNKTELKDMKIIETIFQILSEPYILAFLTTVIIVIVLIVTQD